MKKLLTILLSVLLIASSVLTVNTVRADEFEEEATVEKLKKMNSTKKVKNRLLK